MFVRELSALAGSAVGRRVELLEDYQLQIEHALDLVARERVLFVDASVSCAAPFEVTTLSARFDASFTTHALSPASVMQVYRDLYSTEPPPCTLLAIRGTRFELGEPPGAVALEPPGAGRGMGTALARTRCDATARRRDVRTLPLTRRPARPHVERGLVTSGLSRNRRWWAGPTVVSSNTARALALARRASRRHRTCIS